VSERNIRVAPYSLNRDLGGCHRCFAEALNGEALPERFSTGLGAVCTSLSRQQQNFYNGQPTSVLSKDLPAGVIRSGSGVMSLPFRHEGVALTVRGRIDAIARLDDGRVFIVDFKTGFPNEHTAERFRPQLSAYCWALTNPGIGNARDVAGAGLLVVTPESMSPTSHGLAHLASTTWVPVEYDHEWFISLLETICEITRDPTSARSDIECEWCEIRDRLASSGASE
jgi:hypothetical protein